MVTIEDGGCDGGVRASRLDCAARVPAGGAAAGCVAAGCASEAGARCVRAHRALAKQEDVPAHPLPHGLRDLHHTRVSSNLE